MWCYLLVFHRDWQKYKMRTQKGLRNCRELTGLVIHISFSVIVHCSFVTNHRLTSLCPYPILSIRAAKTIHFLILIFLPASWLDQFFFFWSSSWNTGFFSSYIPIFLGSTFFPVMATLNFLPLSKSIDASCCVPLMLLWPLGQLFETVIRLVCFLTMRRLVLCELCVFKIPFVSLQCWTGFLNSGSVEP